MYDFGIDIVLVPANKYEERLRATSSGTNTRSLSEGCKTIHSPKSDEYWSYFRERKFRFYFFFLFVGERGRLRGRQIPPLFENVFQLKIVSIPEIRYLIISKNNTLVCFFYCLTLTFGKMFSLFFSLGSLAFHKIYHFELPSDPLCDGICMGYSRVYRIGYIHI